MTQQSIRVRELQQVFVKASEATHQGNVESGKTLQPGAVESSRVEAKAMAAGQLSEV